MLASGWRPLVIVFEMAHTFAALFPFVDQLEERYGYYFAALDNTDGALVRVRPSSGHLAVCSTGARRRSPARGQLVLELGAEGGAHPLEQQQHLAEAMVTRRTACGR